MICLTDQPLNCCQNVERHREMGKKWLKVSDENGLKNHMSFTSCRHYVTNYCPLWMNTSWLNDVMALMLKVNILGHIFKTNDFHRLL